VICLKVIRCGVFSLDVEQSIINAVPDSLDELSDVIMRPNAPELPDSTKGQVICQRKLNPSNGGAITDHVGRRIMIC